ncbi:MAG TPA: hypothetical protein VGW34_04735 [Allosphingosinicella sp.]|nr:hypothetical protein [Allosphingosinicella sp.]
MTDPLPSVALALAVLAGLGAVSMAVLSGWRGWLELRRTALDAGIGRGAPRAGVELAELKERVGRLEAIASGADR